MAVLPFFLRVHWWYGPCSCGGSAWQRQLAWPQRRLPADPAGRAGGLRHPGHHRRGHRPGRRRGTRLRRPAAALPAPGHDRAAGPGPFFQRAAGRYRRRRRGRASPADRQPQAAGPAPRARWLVPVGPGRGQGPDHRMPDHHRHHGRHPDRDLPVSDHLARSPPASRLRAGHALPPALGDRKTEGGAISVA